MAKEEKAPDLRKLLEDAHFRLDDNERSIAQLKKLSSPEARAGELSGAAAMIHASVDEKIAKATQRDAEADARVAQLLEKLIECMYEQGERMDRLIEVLLTPSTRVSTVELPSGPVSMRTTETRQ